MEKYSVFLNAYINKTFSSFVSALATYIKTGLLPNSGDIIISTYEKAVEHFRNQKRLGRTNWAPAYPFTVITPNMDTQPVEIAGRFFHGYPNFSNELAFKLYDPPIYQDSNVIIKPVLNRYKGTIDLHIWCSSIYELIDYQVMLYQLFGGLERYIYPCNVTSLLTIPEEFITYNYSNPYDGTSYHLDWSSSTVSEQLIKNINSTDMSFPFTITPYMKLTAINAENTLAGGAGDELSNYKLTCSIEWETSLPTHLLMKATALPMVCKNLQMDINIGYQFITVDSVTSVPTKIPVALEKMTVYNNDTSTNLMDKRDYRYKTAFVYTFTPTDASNFVPGGNPITINFPPGIIVDQCIAVEVYGRYGKLSRDFHWSLESNSSINIVSFNMVNMKAGNYLTIVLYESVPYNTTIDRADTSSSPSYFA